MGKVKSAKVTGEVGKDIDENGNRLYPGFPIVYWTGEGRGDLKAWPGMLSHKLLDGNWAILYFQRASPTYQVTIRHSSKPMIHRWTSKETWIDEQK
jgi:hypothetical protein